MQKTILFKIWKFPQLSETFVLNQVVTAIKLGFDVKILVGECQDFKENSNLQIIDKYNIRDRIIIEDYKIPEGKLLRMIKGFVLLFSFSADWNSFKKFYRLSSKKNFSLIYKFNFYRNFKNVDIFHIQFGTNKHPVDILKKAGLLYGKVVVSFHGHDLYFPINNRIPNNGYYDLLFETAGYLVANTPFLKGKLLEINAPVNKIKIIPVAVSTDIFKPSRKTKVAETVKLITVGRLENFKGQIWGIKAVGKLVNKGLKVEYIIAGDGSLMNTLKHFVKELNLEGSIIFLGAVSQKGVKEALQEADIFLMTSVTDPDYGVESQGLVTAEAQACGLPVVAFDSGGVKSTLEDGKTGFLCKEKDINCFASKIEQLIVNEELRKRMSKNAVNFIEGHYSENSVREKWKSIYA